MITEMRDKSRGLEKQVAAQKAELEQMADGASEQIGRLEADVARQVATISTLKQDHEAHVNQVTADHEARVRRERTAFVFTKEMLEAMGGRDAAPFKLFVELSRKALDVLRNNTTLLINLFIAVRYTVLIRRGAIKPALAMWVFFSIAVGGSLTTYLFEGDFTLLDNILNSSDDFFQLHGTQDWWAIQDFRDGPQPCPSRSGRCRSSLPPA